MALIRYLPRSRPESVRQVIVTVMNRFWNYLAVTEVEAIVQPNCITDDVWRESVSLVCVHLLILTIPTSLFGNTELIDYMSESEGLVGVEVSPLKLITSVDFGIAREGLITTPFGV